MNKSELSVSVAFVLPSFFFFSNIVILCQISSRSQLFRRL